VKLPALATLPGGRRRWARRGPGRAGHGSPPAPGITARHRDAAANL